MTPPAKPDLAATLARLRERFLATSGQLVDAFATIAIRLRADPSDASALEDLRQTAHRTHGTAGSYGFHASSRLAASLEAVGNDWLASPAASSDNGRRARIVENFAALLRASFDGASGAPRRRVLLVEVPDAVLPMLAAEALHRGIAAERTAASAVASTVPPATADGTTVGGVAGEGAALPALDEGCVVVRLVAGADPLSALSACYGSSP